MKNFCAKELIKSKYKNNAKNTYKTKKCQGIFEKTI